MRPDTDIAILGAGCAGLSLATALDQAGVPGRVHLLEPRTRYTRDRTWCFWNTEEHPFSSAISHSWNSWRVSTHRGEARCSSRRYRYCHIAADDFYRQALARIERNEQQELSLNVSVQGVAPHASGLLAIETSAGRLLASKVFDSRPQQTDGDHAPALIQRFLGWRVRTPSPCFDLSTVELMQFLPSAEQGRLRFVYLLPFASDEALVEMTYLDRPTLAEPAYETDLRAWLNEHAPGWEVLSTEQGALPMQGWLPPVGDDPRLLRIGTPAGRIKPSSGYGFVRIQRHSRAIAEALLAGAPAPAHAEPRLYRLMDAIFLQALLHSQEQAQALFLSMFAHADADALLRFLGESSAPAEMMRVAWTLPKTAMLRAALQTAGAVAALGGGGS